MAPATAAGVAGETVEAAREPTQELCLAKRSHRGLSVSSLECALFRVRAEIYAVVQQFQRVRTLRPSP